MTKLKRKHIERALAEAARWMPVVPKGKASFEATVRGMAVDVFIDDLRDNGIEVDESMTEQEVAETVGSI